jgi:hypothetical protein
MLLALCLATWACDDDKSGQSDADADSADAESHEDTELDAVAELDSDVEAELESDGELETDTASETDSSSDTELDTIIEPECARIPTFEDGRSPTRELHVAPDGNDDTGDGSLQAPFASIQRAAALATPGTAIRIHPGTYPGGSYLSELRGSADAPIWLGALPGQARPLLQGGSQALHLVRPRWLIVHDLELSGQSANGINCDDGGDYDDPEAARYVIFRNLSLHDVGDGGNQDCLKLSGLNDFFVLDSEFSSCGGGGSGSGVDHVGCHRGLLARNRFQALSGNAIQCKGGSEDLEIRWNHMSDAGERTVNMGGSTGFEFFRPPLSTSEPNFEARNIRVVANVIEGANASLAFVGCVDCAVVNNTIIDPENWIFRILQETTSTNEYSFLPCGDNLVQNNLIVFNRSELSTYVNIGPNVDAESFRFVTNLWYARDNPSSSAPSLPVSESGGIIGRDPMLSESFGLGAGSPAVQAGAVWDGLLGDLSGACYAVPPSIGALERH